MNNLKHNILFMLLFIYSMASHAYDFEVDGLYYNLISASDKTCELVGGKQDLSAITIPASVTTRGLTLTVISIKANTFENNTAISQVEIYAAIELSASAFSNCTSLSKVILRNGVKSIGNKSFYNCPIDYLSVPNTVTRIGQNSINLVKTIRIEDGETPIRTEGPADSMASLYIGRNIEHGTKGSLPNFKGSTYYYGATSTSLCGSNLSDIEFGRNVSYIPHMLFANCNRLNSITITANIESIEKNAFYGCNQLKSVRIEDSDHELYIDNMYIESKEYKYNSAWLEYKDYYYADVYGAFADSPIEELYIGRNILREKIIPKSGYTYPPYGGVTPYSFYEYRGQDLSLIPNESIKTIDWGRNVTTIPYKFIRGNKGITEITLPVSITTIEQNAFSDCENLLGVYYEGEELVTIEDNAFAGCLKLSEISDLIEKSKSIGNNAFQFCQSLKSISIGNNTIFCGIGTFRDCINLRRFEYTPNYSMLPSDILSGNSDLQWLSLGENVTIIKEKSLGNCKNITAIGTRCTTPPIIESSSDFASINKFSSTLFIPSGTTKDYEQAAGWRDFLFKEEKDIPEFVYTMPKRDDPDSAEKNFIVKGDLTGAIINKINASTSIETLDLQAASIILDNQNVYYETGKRIDDPDLYGDDYDVYRNAPYYSYKYYTAPSTVSGSDMEYSRLGRLINVITTCFDSELTNANLNANLKSIKLPSSLVKLGESAIKGDNLTDLYIFSTTPPTATTASFGSTNKTTCILHVPEGCKEVYASALGWKDFKNIVETTPDNYIKIQPTNDNRQIKLARDDSGAKYQWYKYVEKTGKEIDITNLLSSDSGWETVANGWLSNMHEAESSAILSYEHEFKYGDVLSFDWTVSSEEIFDQLQCYLGDELLFAKSGELSGSFCKTFEESIVGKLSFVYCKDNIVDIANDNVMICNVKLSGAENMTVQIPEALIGETRQELSIDSTANGDNVFCIVTLSDGKQIRSNEFTIKKPNFIKTQPTTDDMSIELALEDTEAKYQWYNISAYKTYSDNICDYEKDITELFRPYKHGAGGDGWYYEDGKWKCEISDFSDIIPGTMVYENSIGCRVNDELFAPSDKLILDCKLSGDAVLWTDCTGVVQWSISQSGQYTIKYNQLVRVSDHFMYIYMLCSKNTYGACELSNIIVKGKRPYCDSKSSPIEGESSSTLKETQGLNSVFCKITLADGRTIVSDTIMLNDAVEPEFINLSTEKMSMKVGDTANVSAIVNPTNSTDTSVRWESSDNDVATVSQNGEITAVSTGDCIIYVKTSNGIIESCEVKVADGESPDGMNNVISKSTEELKVYSLNGTLVMKCRDKAELINLNKGIYVINGEKVIIQ